MEHFKQKKGVIKVCEEFEMTDLKVKFESLLTFLFSTITVSTPDDIHSSTEPIGKSFSKICVEMLEAVKEVKDYLMKTMLMHNLLLISRLGYTLMYLSNIKLNKEDFMYDNLGYKNVLLLVKGGKKMLSTKKSRLFKLIFPISENLIWLYKSQHTKIVKSGGSTYCVLPWQNYFFPMLKKCTELYYTFSNFFITSQAESSLDLDSYKKFISLKVLNMFSQKRKVEVWLGSFRYLYLNSLSTHTSVLELIDSMADYDYDPYFYFLQRLFAENYKYIYENAKDLKIYDILTDCVFDNFDLCAEKFDESIFMTMAPFDRTNEHLKNLKSVLETHDYFSKAFSLNPAIMLSETRIDANDENYVDKLFNNDFNFDPKLCFCIGKYSGEYLKRLVSKEKLSHEFTKIMGNSFTDISTSKGMRQSEGAFWGSKGHDVLFSNKKVKEEVAQFVQNMPDNYKDFQKIVDDSEVSFLDKIVDMKEICLEFDLKDKSQWKGSREIYVMSDTTKTLQQPLEKFFKYLCGWTPNELIHKKSHIRPKFIHGQVFEFESGEEVKTYCTLDCRKWAPRSNIWKYYFYIQGMSSFLPKEFVDYFYQVWFLMFHKKVRIQARYYDILKANSSTEELSNHLQKREDGDYELIMPYSFIMGIYNYLSSLFHAFSQLYFNDKIASKLGASVNLIAHSDDSGGVIMSNSYEKNIDIFSLYETYQKGCNHLMSKKKSSLSRNFFEMISIMYAKKRLIPMTHKFLANMSFEPKGKGWVDDISTVVSKIVEIFSNGGTMLQCYLTMVTMTEMIRKFYHIPRLKNLSRLPLAFGGLFNMHPIHLILLGADAQEIMLDLIENECERSFRIKSYLSICGDYFPGKGSTVNYHIPYYKKHMMEMALESEEAEKIKLVSSVIPFRTLGKKLGHYARLRDQSYIYSLSGVDMSQIFTMTLFTKTFIMKFDNKACDLRKFVFNYGVMNALGLSGVVLEYPQSHYHNYMSAAEGIRIKLSDMDVFSKKTCKPINYNTFQTIGLGLSFQTINEIAAYNANVDVKFLFEDKTKMDTLTQWVKNTLPRSDNFDPMELLTKMSSKDLERVRSCYTFLPSGVAVDTIERFWTYINFYCTRRSYISNRKPQYFTIDQFKLWNEDYDSLKHYYLLLKVALKVQVKKDWHVLKENANCKGCAYKDAAINMVDEIERIHGIDDYTHFETNLPFAVYNTDQNRGINLWYGQSDFKVYTMYGTAELKKIDGINFIWIDVESEEVLDQLFFVFKNFVVTRGIYTPDPTYGINDTSDYKIGFTDLRRPILAPPGFKGMMINDSKIRLKETNIYTLTKSEGKILYKGQSVDFELYQNYDINPMFYKDHKLEQISSLLFKEEVLVDKQDLKNNMLSSKLYKVLMLDGSHSTIGDIKTKYSNEGLLGANRSFSKALMLADKQGFVSYRSSINPLAQEKAVLETQSYKDIPVIDLVNECSFLRVTYKERCVMEKLISEDAINSSDEIVLNSVINKLGIKPTMSAITLTKSVFGNLSYRDVNKLSFDTLNDFVYEMVKAACSCVDDRPKRKNENQLNETKRGILNKLVVMLKLKASNSIIANCLVKFFFRAQNDNPMRFWELRKGNIYCALYKPQKKNIHDQYFFMNSCITEIKRVDPSFKKLFTIRQITLADSNLRKKEVFDHIKEKIEEELEDGAENFSGVVRFEMLTEKNFYLDPDSDSYEDDLDAINGGDDPEEPLEREWDEDSETKEFTFITLIEELEMMEKLLSRDYAHVTIKSLGESEYYPFLGYGNYYLEEDSSGIIWHVAEYPGSTKPPKLLKSYAPTVKVVKQAAPIEIDTEPPKPRLETRLDQEKLFGFESEDDAYRYQCEVLIANGIFNPHSYDKYFFKKARKTKDNSLFDDLDEILTSKAFNKKERLHASKRIRTQALPGFSGCLTDKELLGELTSLFGRHAQQISAGNHSLTSTLYKNLLTTARRLYKPATDNEKALIISLCSMMKDCVISNSSDEWFSEPVMAIFNEIEERYTEVDDNYQYVPRPMDSVMKYTEVMEYDDEDLA
jgi:hypothetical protein